MFSALEPGLCLFMLDCSMARSQVVPFERRAIRPRRLRPRAFLLLAATAGVLIAVGSFMATGSWPVDVKLRHLLAATNCSTARAVGLAPALRGEPGYYLHLDADGDGIACEPYSRR